MNFSELFNYNKNDESRIKSVMCLLNCSESEAVMYLKKEGVLNEGNGNEADKL